VSLTVRIKVKHRLTFLHGDVKVPCSTQLVSRDEKVEVDVSGCHGNERNKIPAGSIPITFHNPSLRWS